MIQKLLWCLLLIFRCVSVRAMSRVLMQSPKSSSQNILYSPSSSAYKHQAAISFMLEKHIHQLYAALNSLKDGKNKDAIALCIESCNALQALTVLLDPKKIVHCPELNSFALEMCDGIEYMQQCLFDYIQALEQFPSMDPQIIIEGIEHVCRFRKSFFASFMQWDERLIAVSVQIHDIAVLIDAIQKGIAEKISRFKKWGDYFFDTSYEYPITESQVRGLQKSFQHLSQSLQQITLTVDSGSVEQRSLEQMISLVEALTTVQLSAFRNKNEALKSALQKLNKQMLTIPQAGLSAEECRLLQQVDMVAKSTIFPQKTSSIASLQQCGTDVLVNLAQGTLLVSDEVLHKIQRLEALCSQLAQAVSVGGAFEKNIDACIDLAQKLQNEKAVIKTIAQQMHDYNIEQLVGFTTLLQNIAALVQDIAKNETAWSNVLQKLNPELHAFLRSCEKENIAETLKAAEEIAKTLNIKQPISQIALICARHGSTIKLALGGIKLCMQPSGPYFQSYAQNFNKYSEALADFIATIQTKAQETLLQSLTNYDIAQAFQVMAQTNVRVDVYQKRALDELEVEMKVGAEAVHHDLNRDDLNIEELYVIRAQLQNQFFETSYQIENLDESSPQKKALEENSCTIKQRLAEEDRKLNRAIDTIKYRREGKFEPFCSKSEVFGVYKELALLRHDANMIRTSKKALDAQLVSAQNELQNLWGPFHKNITSVVIYVWKYLTYLRYWIKKSELQKRIAVLGYQRQAWEAAEVWNEKQQEKVSQALHVLQPDQACKHYFKALHKPLFKYL